AAAQPRAIDGPSWLSLDRCHEAVPLPNYRLQVTRALGVVTQRPAQLGDPDVHRPRRCRIVPSPDLIQQPLPPQHLTLMQHQILEQSECLGRETDLPPFYEGSTCRPVDAEIAGKQAAGAGERLHLRVAAPKDRSDAGYQLEGIER